MNCSVLALGSSPNAWPCKWPAMRKNLQPAALGLVPRALRHKPWLRRRRRSAFRSSSQLASSQPSKPVLAIQVEPAVLGHVAELAAHQANLMIRMLAGAMRCGLMMAHEAADLRSCLAEANAKTAEARILLHRGRIAREREFGREGERGQRLIRRTLSKKHRK